MVTALLDLLQNRVIVYSVYTQQHHYLPQVPPTQDANLSSLYTVNGL